MIARKRLIDYWPTAMLLGFTVCPALATEDPQRVLRKEMMVPASPQAVWNAWTTSKGIASFFASQSKIELRVGGMYELYLNTEAKPGKRGTEGCRVLSHLPFEMLSFEWNFPPTIPTLRDAGNKTHVVLHFDQLPNGHTKVRLAQLGWQEGKDWDAGYAYFDQAWSRVLDRLRDRFTSQTPPASDAPAQSESWIEGSVTVTSVPSPVKHQTFEVALPVAVAQAWHALTTEDGLRRFISPSPTVELTPGGTYEVFAGTGTRVQALVPLELLVVSGSAPLEFPNVRMGGTWAVIELIPDGDIACLVRMSVYGWHEGDEWNRAFEYFLHNNAMFLDLLRKRFTEGPLQWSAGDKDAPPTFKRLPLDSTVNRAGSGDTGTN